MDRAPRPFSTMPGIQVVTGAPFSGKGQYVRDEIARREREGELGLTALDFTALYTALVPGVQSRFRDEAVSDTGAPRMVAYVFEIIAAAMAARELSGYIVTQSPRQAIKLADRFTDSVNVVMDVPVDDMADVADRAGYHLTKMGRLVPRSRAARAAALANCRRAAVTYFNERPALAGRAREVRRSGRGWKTGGTVRQFNRELWIRGLTPRGREALNELIRLGNPEPMPADVMAFLLRNRVDG